MNQQAWKNEPFLSFSLCACNVSFLIHLQVHGEGRSDLRRTHGSGDGETVKNSPCVGAGCCCLSSQPASFPPSLPPSHSSFHHPSCFLPVSLPIILSFSPFVLSICYMPVSSGTWGCNIEQRSKKLESRRKTPHNQMISQVGPCFQGQHRSCCRVMGVCVCVCVSVRVQVGSGHEL